MHKSAILTLLHVDPFGHGLAAPHLAFLLAVTRR
jgi:hypothetical protein